LPSRVRGLRRSSRRQALSLPSAPTLQKRSLTPPASSFTGGRKVMAYTGPLCPSSPAPRASNSTAPTRYQSRMTPSSPPEARRPSRGVKASVWTAPSWPGISRTAPVASVTTRTTPSSPAAARNSPPGSMATARSGAADSANSFVTAPAASETRRARPSSPAVATRSLSGATATALQPPGWAARSSTAVALASEARCHARRWPSAHAARSLSPAKARPRTWEGASMLPAGFCARASKRVTAEVADGRAPPTATRRPSQARQRTRSKWPRVGEAISRLLRARAWGGPRGAGRAPAGTPATRPAPSTR
jgi:hypothetical protein